MLRTKKFLVNVIAVLSLVGFFNYANLTESADASTKTVSTPYLLKHGELTAKLKMDRQDHRYNVRKNMHPFSLKITNNSKYNTRFYFTQLYNKVYYYSDPSSRLVTNNRVVGPHKNVFIRAHHTVTVNKAYYLNDQSYAGYFAKGNGGSLHYGKNMVWGKVNKVNGVVSALALIEGSKKSSAKHFYQTKKFYSYN